MVARQVTAALMGTLAMAGPVTAQPVATMLDTRLPVTLAGVDYDLAARVYRPAGQGPFPLVVINHGTPADKRKLPDTRIGFARAAQWFVQRGYIVVIALRPGFGSSSGRYLEAAGSCRDEDYVVAGRRTAAIEGAIVTAATRLPGVDPERIVVVGQSAGGFGAIALGDAPPPGVHAIISFAGGRGGDGREHICAGESDLVAAAATFGRANRVPQLWLYADNDHFFRPGLARRMVDAYARGSAAPVRFVPLPPFANDGHKTFAQGDPAIWAVPVASFLDRTVAR